MAERDYCSKITGTCPHKISRTKQTCFIMMQYEEIFSDEIERMLKNTVEEVFKLKSILSKDIRHMGSADMYCTKVCRPIKQATLCIADLTYNNSNVGYEFALAQSFKKPVIVTRYLPNIAQLLDNERIFIEDLKKKGLIQYSKIPSEPPSDIQGIFRIDYADENELKRKMKEGFKIE